jgi:hypothetical protein
MNFGRIDRNLRSQIIQEEKSLSLNILDLLLAIEDIVTRNSSLDEMIEFRKT